MLSAPDDVRAYKHCSYSHENACVWTESEHTCWCVFGLCAGLHVRVPVRRPQPTAALQELTVLDVTWYQPGRGHQPAGVWGDEEDVQKGLHLPGPRGGLLPALLHDTSTHR